MVVKMKILVALLVIMVASTESCHKNSDCRSTTRWCEGGTFWSSGTCTHKQPGQSCHENAQCSTQWCQGGTLWSAGTCWYKQPNGGPCYNVSYFSLCSKSELGSYFLKIWRGKGHHQGWKKFSPNSDFDEICKKRFVYHFDDPFQISRRLRYSNRF